jgi:Na+(H+)/acetate symporter ActP
MTRSAADVHHDLSNAHEDVPVASDRSVGFVLGVAAIVIGVFPVLRGHPVRLWAFAVAAPLLLLAFVRPSWLRPVNRAWMAFGALGQVVMTFVLMAIIFYGIVTPLAWVRRALGHDVLRLKFEPLATTYWIERQPPGPLPASMKNQF